MKNVLITGAANGIGNHLARAFALEKYNVIAIDKELCTFAEPNISFYQVDLCDMQALSSFFAEIKERFTALHILINNAAISHFEKHISLCEEKDFDDIFSVNVKALYFCSKEFVALNKGQNFGRIINLASTRFAQNEPNWDLYGSTKGAVASLTSSLCVSLTNTPITVNSISAGWIATGDYSEIAEQDHRFHPSGRVGKPSDISSYCLFLSQESNDFINGSNLFIDGGVSKKMIYL